MRDVQFEHSGRATYGDPARGKRGRCPSGSPATSAARAWRDRLQARAARDFAPSNGTRQNTVAQIHAGGATPPRRSSSVGETATPVTERSWECLWLTPGRSLLLRLFVSSILRLSEDVWFLHFVSCARLGVFCRSPFDGRPQGGGHLDRTPSQGFERRVPRIHLSVGPRYIH